MPPRRTESSLSPKALALALGVSESSLKRWVDSGRLQAVRTTGGHRRIPVGEALRFIRATGAPVVDPGSIGLHDLPGADTVSGDASTDSQRLFDHLRSGEAVEARGLMLALYLSGRAPAELCDHVMAPAMHRVGELWKHDETGVFVEHRATDICVQSISQLRGLVEVSADAPVALGGAPAGDPYMLPSMMASLALAHEGFRAHNLGPNTPAAALEAAVEEHRPALVWISCSVPPVSPDLARQFGSLTRSLAESGVSVVVGGRVRDRWFAPGAKGLYAAASFSEFVAYARGHAAAKSEGPRRRRDTSESRVEPPRAIRLKRRGR